MAETLSPTYKLFKGLSTNATELYRESVQFLQQKFKTSGDIFTLASPFGQLLIVLHNLTELILFYIEDSITELNIYEANRPSSVYSLASLSGHNPSRALSAVGTIQVKPSLKVDFTKIPGNRLIFTKYMNLNCENNGLNYVVEMPGDEARLDMKGTTGLNFTIRQGRLQQQTFGSTGEAFQSLQLGYPNNFLIDQFLVNVYVNGERWENYQSMLDIPRNGNCYVCKTGITNGLDIYFGNGSFGKIPPTGAEIIVEYLITEGAVGNIVTDALSELIFTFTDTALNTIGEEVTLTDMVTVSCVNSPNFGTDPESLALTRLLAPKASKNFALVNVDNYEVLMRKLQMFSSVRVTLDPDDNRVINIFLVPDITKIFARGVDYFNLIEDRFKLTAFQKTELLKYITPKESIDWFKELNQYRIDFPYDPVGLKQQDILLLLDKLLDQLNLKDKLLITSGVGNHQMYAAQLLTHLYPNRFITSGSLGSMSSANSMAIGVKIAYSNFMVISIDDNQSFNMVNDLKMILNYNIAIKIIIMNDSKHSMVNIWKKLFFNNNIVTTETINPDYNILAYAYNIKCIEINKSMNLSIIEQQIRYFLHYDIDKPIILNCIIDSDFCLPLIPPGNTLNDMLTYHTYNDHKKNKFKINRI